MTVTYKDVADIRVFNLEKAKDREGKPILRIRYKLRKQFGPGPENLKSVSFITRFSISSLREWDKDLQLLSPSAPNAAHVNAELTRIKQTAAEAIEAGMTENEVRELMGIAPVRVLAPRKVRKDKDTIRLETAKKVLVENGYTQRISTPQPEPEPAEAMPTLHPDAETNELLHRFRPLAQPPVLAAAPPPAPVATPAAAAMAWTDGPKAAEMLVNQPQEYWLVVDGSELGSQLQRLAPRFSAEEAQAYATAQALQTNRPHFIYHCQPTARVQVSVQIDQL